MKKYYTFTSSDRVNTINVVMWLPKGQPRAIVQLSHGMTEHIERYDEFANYLVSQGMAVVGNDHIGHGKSASKESDLGYFGNGDAKEYLTRDLYVITKNMKRMYGDNIPYILCGHSMGSLIARRYAANYGCELDGLLLMGTTNQPFALLYFARSLVNVIALIKGERYRSNTANSIMFGLYNSRIKNARTQSDWLTCVESEVDRFIADKRCNYSFTVNGLRGLLNIIIDIQKPHNIDNIPKNLPIFLACGNEDPVGDYGMAVRYLKRLYRSMGIHRVKAKVYNNCRHELINETRKYEFFKDSADWIKEVSNER